jgi:NADPH:quinone reductase-like Zn-dependent oxidoreductase
MKPVLLDEPGPPSSLRIGEVDIPPLGGEDALVRVYATSLNPIDFKVAAQGYHLWHYPHVLGVDVAGVIEAVGQGVKNWNVGENVFYHTTWRRPGSYAEFNVAPAHTFARIFPRVISCSCTRPPEASVVLLFSLEKRRRRSSLVPVPATIKITSRSSEPMR